jgi:hypothetical protein
LLDAVIEQLYGDQRQHIACRRRTARPIKPVRGRRIRIR